MISFSAGPNVLQPEILQDMLNAAQIVGQSHPSGEEINIRLERTRQYS